MPYASAKGSTVETLTVSPVHAQINQRANEQRAFVAPKRYEAIASQPVLANSSLTRMSDVARVDVSIRGIASDFDRDIESSFRVAVPSAMLTGETTVINSADAYLVSVGHLMSIGKLSEAVERLREFAKLNEVNPALRYRALSMLKSCYERMGEWLMAKAVSEQMTSELSQFRDIKLVGQVADVEDDTQVERRAQTRLASLPSLAQPTPLSNASAVQPNAVKASAPEDTSSQLQQSISILEGIPQDEPTEKLLSNDQTFIDALFKLSEAI
jgi:hypothetical protein